MGVNKILGNILLEEAMVLIKIEPNRDKTVLNVLRSRNDIKNAYLLYGPFDAYFELVAGSLSDIENVITNVIRKIPGVRSSMTCFIAD
jgi:DNA-binding Lrp family transcriptional regulator